MYYPINIICAKTQVSPLFGDQLRGKPYVFDFSSSSPNVLKYRLGDLEALQKQIFDEIRSAGASWGVGRYLEERKLLLSFCHEITAQRRWYHAGLDIMAGAGSSILAPLDGEVFQAGFEGGAGNYGGYVILRHCVSDSAFFTFYGHLDSSHLPVAGEAVHRGSMIGRLGAGTDSGGWFSHLHFQVLTEEAIAQERLLQGYVCRGDLPMVQTFFPSPYTLFRV